MELLDVFDDVLVISLGKPQNELLRGFNRIDGVSVSKEETEAYKDVLYASHLRAMAQKVVGCRQAHINAINYAKSKNLNNVLVLEDDCMFTEDYYRALPGIKKFLDSNDWALFYLGGKNFRRWCIELVCGDTVTGAIAKTIGTYATHSIAYNGKYFDKIIEAFTRDDLMPIDHCLCGLPVAEGDTFQRRYPCYCAYPAITWQKDHYDKGFWFCT